MLAARLARGGRGTPFPYPHTLRTRRLLPAYHSNLPGGPAAPTGAFRLL
jgi:hypothetical protein